ncbi:MAG: hypothetical protein NUV78_00390 [Candidatus Zambryskibacteria bacterium]|nr:hypothetical protein [Candidatus Zambryskibacteria bacterium]
MKRTFNALAGFLFFVAFLPYIWAILQGQTQPSPVSWAIWATVDTLVLIAMKKERVASGQITGAVAGAWVITILALFYGAATMGTIEWVSILGAAAGIALWQWTGNAVLAIICSCIALLVGAIPTFANAWANPAQEDPIAWSIWLASCVFALLAVRKWTVADTLQPLTFTAIEATMVTLVVVKPLF